MKQSPIISRPKQIPSFESLVLRLATYGYTCILNSVNIFVSDTTNSEHHLCVDGSPETTPPESILTSLSIHQKTPDGNPEFVELNLRFRCLICNYVLRDAVQSMCGHRFCFMCAQSFFASTRLRCPANEEDCMDITITEVNDHGDKVNLQLLFYIDENYILKQFKF